MNVNTYAHHFLRDCLKGDEIAVDMTIGNGNDTLFLAEHCKFVYGFDIQEKAIEKTNERLRGRDNYQLYLANHAEVDKYVSKANLFVFNLGYLPHSDSKIITKADDTLCAFNKAYDLLSEGGLILICFYFHPGGYEEYKKVYDHIDLNGLRVISIYREIKPYSPLLYIIRK
ncbi:MAG: class I SAM-dependent methyltransferase [Erysipelotrichaceae bacterium]|nr:class I SAM-dependent methyltransferase [Erysipelotrichaceae bacterium]